MLEETRDLHMETEAIMDGRSATPETHVARQDGLETQMDSHPSDSQTNSFYQSEPFATKESSRPVLILSAQDDDQFALYSVEAAEVDRLFQGCAPDELVNAVRRLIDGGQYLGSVQNQDTSANGKTKPKDVISHQKLSQRELQIVTMLGAGKSVGAIAVELGLSVKTISTYRTRALEKMNFKTNADLIRYVIEHELVA